MSGRELAEKITDLYARFGVKIGELISASDGARVTRLEFQLDPDMPVSKITRLRDDLSLMLGVPKVRIICPVRGKMAFAMEVPNGGKEFVSFDAVFESQDFRQSKDKLCVALGKNVNGENACLELSRAPHVLIGGQAYSGKTTLLKNMIVSLLCNTAPAEVKLLLVAPKKEEFEVFEGSAHLLQPVIDDAQGAIDSLQALWSMCEERYGLFQARAVRNIDDYNAVAEEPLFRVVAVVDEISFLSRRDRNSFEQVVCRLAQKGRAAGIHLVLATKELSPQNVSGLIKACVPTRIALSTENAIASRTIMDAGDAECLLMKGDLLLCDIMMHPPQRIQAAYLTPEQIQEKIKNG